jgi:hypothetical protein
MPLLNPLEESGVIALIAIAYGMRWERHYTAWISVVMNVVFTVVLLSSTDLPPQMDWIVGVYIALGIICAWRTLRKYFFLFGEKTFGALSLTVTLTQANLLGWTTGVATQLTSQFTTLDFQTAQYLISWVVITAIVQIAGRILFPSS